MATARAQSADRREVERQALAIVQGLVTELGGLVRPVTLDDSLERHLGIGSLERVELLLRLEQAFGVRLPDDVMASAERPRDLVSALLASAPAAPERVTERRRAPAAAPTLVPESARTLTDVLRRYAEADPERVHIVLRGDDGQERPITYGALLERASAVAAGLRERGLGRGQSVALMLRTEPAFFDAFFGVLLAGGVPVPIYPPFRPDRLEEYAERQIGILDNAQARWLLTFQEAERVAGLLRPRVPSLRGVTTPEQLAAPGVPPLAQDLTADDPALIQYTSGSTGAPKGVLLTHANILANIRAIGESIEIRPDDVAVSWLPLYHDMGLIGSWLGALYWSVPIAILSPLAFLARPGRWLWMLHAHRGTISAAPNFAFDLCARKVRDDEIQGLDLSAWRLALNGSEPVSAETIERFTNRFAPYGFKPEAMCPVYGLAESSVALTVSPIGRGPRVDRVAREPFLGEREARPAPPDAPAPLRFVSCGRPLPGHEVRVVDADGRALGERVEGRVEFRGPSVTSGYFRNPAATRGARRDTWMDSGDLGYWADGELYITGRQKDMIIKAGRNIYPQEVEEVVGDVAGIRKGCVAVFGVPDPAIGTERLVVVAETRETAAATRERLRAAVVERVVAALGIPPDTVVIGDPGSVLKTSSGKIRRGATRDAYLRRDLARRRSARAQWARLVLRGLAPRLRQLARDAARLAFSAYAWSVIGLGIPVLWGLVLAAPRGSATHRIVSRWCRWLLTLIGCRPRVDGLEHLRGVGAAVLASNHASYLDALVLLAAIPVDFRFVAKRELLAARIVGTVIRKAGHLAVERMELGRSVADADRVTRELQRGVSLLIFPEGTFVRAPGLRPFRLGAFKAAVEAGRPVIPVAIRGTRDVLPADTWLPRRGSIAVAIAAPIRPEAAGWQEIVRIRDRARTEIARRSGEHPEPV